MAFWCSLSLMVISSPTLHQKVRDVDLAALHAHVAVKHELPRLRARRGDAHAINHVVETALEHDHEIRAGGPLARSAFSK